MYRSQENHLKIPIAVRISQLRARVQQDVFRRDHSSQHSAEKKTLVTYYLKTREILNECGQVDITWNELLDNLPWNDWYDRW